LLSNLIFGIHHKKFRASELDVDNNPYLMVYNADEAKDGSYEVTVENPE
jgi:hypothetical protein